jgi:hypothetical protein
MTKAWVKTSLNVFLPEQLKTELELPCRSGRAGNRSGCARQGNFQDYRRSLATSAGLAASWIISEHTRLSFSLNWCTP